MKAKEFLNFIFPSIWWVSDHGNVSLYKLSNKAQKKIKV